LICFQVEVSMFQDGLPEATALGAALLAWVGVGEYADFDEACRVGVRYSTKHTSRALQ
jgi:hypothetical protein